MTHAWILLIRIALAQLVHSVTLTLTIDSGVDVDATPFGNDVPQDNVSAQDLRQK